MTQDLKQIVIYGAFGLLLGAKIVEVLLTRSDTGIIDWWLLLIGVGAAVVHYFPTKAKPQSADAPRQAAFDATRDDEDTLVLRDHPNAERGSVHRSNPSPPERDAAEPFV
ncbi:hypothetical protein CLV84_2121 [Neolewinella xylanilytica]|uniref:Uncharacterized protein n=1 Tax=Neolewinella xylanilytica TaxID=1514080 RepID=A0A2S6I2C1_9BACT|nr:hypothetical protein [Neolewinella xylanilytica]PPK85229.1 hypothetical protein CLV84_2121 [Neolewinella xylanilytica]